MEKTSRGGINKVDLPENPLFGGWGAVTTINSYEEHDSERDGARFVHHSRVDETCGRQGGCRHAPLALHPEGGGRGSPRPNGHQDGGGVGDGAGSDRKSLPHQTWW